MKKYVPKNQKADYLSKFDDRRPAGYPPESEFPPVIILKRKAIRVYPDNQKIALYYSQALDKYISIPIGPNNKAMGMYMNEETKVKDDSDDDDKKKKKVVEKKVPHESFIKNNIGAVHPELYAAYKEAKKRKNEHDAFLHAMSRLTKEQFRALPIKTQIEAHKHFRQSIDLASSKSFNHFMANLGGMFGSNLREMYLKRREIALNKKSGTEPETETSKQETPKETSQETERIPVQDRLSALKARINKPKPGPRKLEEASDCFARILAEKRGERIDEWQKTALGALNALDVASDAALLSSPFTGVGGLAAGLGGKALVKGAKYFGGRYLRKKIAQKAKEEAKKKTQKFGDRMAGKPLKPGKRAPRGTGARAYSRYKNIRNKIGAGLAATAAGLAAGAAAAGKRAGEHLKDLNPLGIPNFLMGMATQDSRPRRVEIGGSERAVWGRSGISGLQSPSMEESTIETLNYIVENNIDVYPVTINERTINVNKSIAKKIVNVYESLNKKNRKKARKMLDESVDSFRNFTNFALRY